MTGVKIQSLLREQDRYLWLGLRINLRSETGNSTHD